MINEGNEPKILDLFTGPASVSTLVNILLETAVDASERTLWSSLKVGERGPSGLDVRGLEGGQDEGHLSAVQGQFGEQVIICSHSSARVWRRRLVLRQLQWDPLERRRTS